MATRIAAPPNPKRTLDDRLVDSLAKVQAAQTALDAAIANDTGTPTRAQFKDVQRALNDGLRAIERLIKAARGDYTGTR